MKQAPGSLGYMTEIETKRRRTYAGEEAWFPVLDELGHRGLRAGFIHAGVSPVVAGNLVFWLEDQARLDRHFSKEQGVQYRRILRGLDPVKVARATPGQFNSTRWARLELVRGEACA